MTTLDRDPEHLRAVQYKDSSHLAQRANLPALANELAGRVPKVEAHEAPSAPA